MTQLSMENPFVGHRSALFVGVDSDGCVFDTMESKQRKAFHPLIISHWGLDSSAASVRETACFVNLYSAWRGSNRFVALLKTFELLATRADIRSSKVDLPGTEALAAYVASGVAMGEPSLALACKNTNDSELTRVLAWSRAVNTAIADLEMEPPFPGADDALAQITANAEVVVISQTPAAALEREWTAYNLTRYVRAIAGQEVGSKTLQLLRYAAEFPPARRLMIGDARGDALSAAEAHVHFYPILPGREVESWRRFREEAWPRFLQGQYAGAYEAELQQAFDALLPASPPWPQIASA